MREALDALDKRKEAERAAAIVAMKAECDGLVAKANADRDEYLALYTKVNGIFTTTPLYLLMLRFF